MSEREPFAQGLQFRIAVPHDLMPWIQVFGAADVSAELGYQTDSVAEPSGLGESFFFCVGLQHFDLGVGEQDLGGKIGAPSAQERHEHDPPGDDEIDGDGPFESLSGLVLQRLDATAALQYAMPVFDAPAQAVPPQALLSLFWCGDLTGGDQEPFDRFGAGWRRGFVNMHHPQPEGVPGTCVLKNHMDLWKPKI